MTSHGECIVWHLAALHLLCTLGSSCSIVAALDLSPFDSRVLAPPQSEGMVPKTLKPGHVITCEPGLYFIDPLIDKAAAKPETAMHLNLERIASFRGMGGVRIEDNVLILKVTISMQGITSEEQDAQSILILAVLHMGIRLLSVYRTATKSYIND